MSDFTDFFVILTVDSKTQMRSISKFVQEKMKKLDSLLLNLDGFQSSNWIVLDYGDVIAHIMSKEAKDYYNLENLWKDAKKIELENSILSEKIEKIEKKRK